MKAQYQSGYRLEKRPCEFCGDVKLIPTRNKYCSRKCSSRAIAQNKTEETASPASNNRPVEELLAPKDGFIVSENIIVKPPEGWSANLKIKGEEGEGTSQIYSIDVDDEMIIKGWDLDPEKWEIIDGTLECRRWQATVNRGTRSEPKHEPMWLRYYKAKLRRRTSESPQYREVMELVEDVKGWSEPKTLVDFTVEPSDQSMMIFIADPQIGKSDNGGTKKTYKQFIEGIDRIESYIRNEVLYTGIRTCYLVGMGDLIENCAQNYSTQTFTTELTRRAQVNLIRRMILGAIKRLAPYFDEFIVTCVGGNHGENRIDGQMFTDPSDNDDVAVFDQLEDIISESPEKFPNVSFRIPDGERALAFNVSGVWLGITHGHLSGKGSGNPEKRQMDWWAKQAHGMTPIGQVKILVTAHFHHFVENNDGQKTLFICPALESGSAYFKDATGKVSYPGIMTMFVGENAHHTGRGYDRVRVF